jgi:PhnB protein
MRRPPQRKPSTTRKRSVSAGTGAAAVKNGRRSSPSNPTTRKRGKPAGTAPGVIPMISYEDGIAALDWLHRAFGFRETARLADPDGRLSHGEMAAGDGLIMLASPTPEYQGPKRHREVCEQARRWSMVPWIIDGVLVYVDDLAGHFARAKAAGARILSEIEMGPPGRRYRAEDLEGHRWFFFEKSRS